MNTEQQHIEVRGIRVEVVRKDIKNLHIGVYPPHGRVRAATPFHLDDEAVRLAIVSRLPWIKKQRRSFQEQKRQSPRKMVSGESHYFQGKRYRLDVVHTKSKQGIRLRNKDRMELKVFPHTSRDQKFRMLQRWYRKRLKKEIPPLQKKWEKELGIEASEVKVRIMKTRWGSCNIEARRIWLNLELIKKPLPCLEYILVHEMVHFFERRHTERFRELMDQYLPDWRYRRDELNKAPLAHEEWGY